MLKGNIPGIHNYCDRWCERCFFTSHCSVFADTNESSIEEKDIRNKAFWERLSQNFSKAKGMLEDAAKKSGVDLNALQADIEISELKKEEVRLKSQKHPLVALCKAYGDFGRTWLKTQPGMMDRLQELKENLIMGVETRAVAKIQTETIKDSLAVIQWYLTFMEVKFMRALMDKEQGSLETQTSEVDLQHDYNGSAKIGIIGAERSTQAWIKLFEILPDQEDDFLKALSMLEKIKGDALAAFPNSMKFVRPGFDEFLKPD